jgi:hypothetical protein
MTIPKTRNYKKQFKIHIIISQRSSFLFLFSTISFSFSFLIFSFAAILFLEIVLIE